MRLYLEYAPYGTLANLLARYKAFNRYLPELFLWHLFNSLARAILTLEQDVPGIAPYYLAHLDIKPENIFLGYETPKRHDSKYTGGLKDDNVKYPTIKLGDFGLGLPLKRAADIAMHEVGEVGTPHYLSPVG